MNGLNIRKQIYELARKGKIPPVETEDIQKFQKFRETCSQIKDQFAITASFRRNASFAFTDLNDLDFYRPAGSFRQDTKQTFEALFRHSLKKQKYNTSGSRLFRGKWAKITAIPLYDLPLHLSGFLFVNGHELGEPPYIIRRLSPFAGKQYLFDPGFLGSRAVYRKDQSAVILCPQWKLTLLLQSAVFRQENESPPLLGWFPVDPRTKTANTYHWSALKDIPKIFWSTPEDLYSLREACLQQGLVSYAYFNHAGHFSPPSKMYGPLLRSIIKTADPWHKALTHYLTGDLAETTDRLKKLGLPPKIIEQYVEHAPAVIRNTLTAKMSSIESNHARYIDGSRILSNEDGWWKLGSGLARSLLSNTRCAIEKVIHIADDQPIYQGKIFIGKETYSFTEKEDIFERHPIPTVKNVCIENGCTQFLRINVKNDAYLRLVKETSVPETIYRKEGYGWSKKESSLLLPNVTISDTSVIDTAIHLQTGPLHKITVQRDKPLGHAERTALANFQEETPIVFSIFSAIVPALFAPAYRMRPPQTVIAGGDFMLVKQVSDMLGLPNLRPKSKDEIDRYLMTHRCPFLVRLSTNQKKKRITHEWADTFGINTPALVWTSVTEALARMSYGQSNLLLLPGTRFYRWFDGRLPSILQDCFTACLKHLSRYVLDPIPHTEDWNNDLLKETFRFFKEEIGIAPAKNTLFGGYYAGADYFYDYVNLLYRAEMVDITDGQNLCVVKLAECYRQHVGIFDFQQINDYLQQSDAVGEYDAKKQILVLQAERLLKSKQRLEKFYGTLLRN